MQTNATRTNTHDNANVLYNTNMAIGIIIYYYTQEIKHTAVDRADAIGRIDFSASELKFSKRNFLAAPK